MIVSETKYYGIYRERHDGDWWITDSSGGDEYFGPTRPTDQDIDNYRNNFVRN